MSLIHVRNINLSYGDSTLFENVNFTIEKGERVCLIGRNGAGKSTLLKLMMGEIEADSGVIERPSTLKFALLPQEIPHSLSGTIKDIVMHQAVLAGKEEWQLTNEIEKILSKLELNGDHLFQDASGGIKRRVLLAGALIHDPDVLLLDEPTNHLDIEAIKWLENFLLNFHKTLIMITHDRVLMQNVATHIVEIDTGIVISWRGHYQDYLKHKETLLLAEERAQALFEKKLTKEEQWIRQGIKARRTRNEGRVRALKKMREQWRQRRIRQGTVSIEQHDLEQSGKMVFDVHQIYFSYGMKNIINQFSTTIMRGDKIGIIGANGSGKSTLLNLLLGHLKPDSGNVRQGTQLTVGYCDQHRIHLEENKTVLDNVSEGSDFVIIGDRKKHVLSYLQDFLFSPLRARCLIKSLSGGERNRVMLAKLFLKNYNLLVLDEPTNDLDFETLELLEEQLIEYPGTVILVSHDRAFLNNVVTSTLVMEENGHIGEYVGGYDDWMQQRKSVTLSPVVQAIIPKKESRSRNNNPAILNSKEKRELEELPQKVEILENRLSVLHDQLNDPDFYKQDADQIAKVYQQIKGIDSDLKIAYERWEFLEKKSK